MKTAGVLFVLCLVFVHAPCAFESSTITAQDIINAPGGTRENPVHISLKAYDLGSMHQDGSGWFLLLRSIETAGKFVSLDLSGCKMTGTVFDHRYDYAGKDKIVSLVLPDAATSIIGSSLYFRPTFNSVTSVRGANINTLGNNAFNNCTELKNVDFPKAVAVGNNAFAGCGKLALESLPPGISYIGDSAFVACKSLALTSLPAGVRYIGSWAFEACENLALTSLPEGITSISQVSFKDCTSLALKTLPPRLESISHGAFINCTGLTRITLPASLLSLGAFAFRDCVNLSEIICEALVPPKPYFFDSSPRELLRWEPFDNTSANLEIKVPVESVRVYRRVDGWWEYADRISGSETDIPKQLHQKLIPN
jgi:hypothetical protein